KYFNFAETATSLQAFNWPRFRTEKVELVFAENALSLVGRPDFVPVAVKARQTGIPGFDPIFAAPRLDMMKAPGELEIGVAQRPFGIDAGLPGQIGDSKQQVADLLVQRGLIATGLGF